jgi:alkylation response protein AidB-like acyl-CoA dehydrogenase
MSLSAEERDELRTTARTMLTDRCSSERVRAVTENGDGFDADLWSEIVDLGWAAIHVEERYGGAGCGFRDLIVILHELGRVLAPTPFLASTVLATGALVAADEKSFRSSHLTDLASGVAIGSVALASADGSYDIDDLSVRWRSEGNGIVLQGESGFALDADMADFLVVAARGADAVPAVALVETDVSGLRRRRIPIVDQTRRMFSVDFDGVVVPATHLLCPPGPAAAALHDRVLALGVVAAAADAAGVAEQALEATTAYAGERQQFGKPIGSFQAVKHHCANMAVNVEASRAATTAAALSLDDDPAGWTTTAGIIASYVGPACSEVCALAMRVHGGIGFTWEHDTHRQMKRVKLDEVLFGRPSWHRRRLADAVFPTLPTTSPAKPT